MRSHSKNWSQKVKNLTNYPLEGIKDKKYVAMFQKLVDYTVARLEYTETKLDGLVKETNNKQDS